MSGAQHQSNRSSFALAAAGAALATAAVVTYLVEKKNAKDRKSGVLVTLPDWLLEYETSLMDKEFTSDEEMMAVAIVISARNAEEKTGGPFGTAIFERAKATGQTKLVAVGCNRVVPLGNSTLHGEMTAIQFAQTRLGTHSLGPTDLHEYVLCTSCEPCCMCLGGVLWSGVSEMVCSGTKADAEAIGFNEGPVFPASYQALEESGMRVRRCVSQPAAAAVLERYGREGVIY